MLHLLHVLQSYFVRESGPDLGPSQEGSWFVREERRVKMLEMFMAQRRRAESPREFVATLLWMAITSHLGGQAHCQNSVSLSRL